MGLSGIESGEHCSAGEKAGKNLGKKAWKQRSDLKNAWAHKGEIILFSEHIPERQCSQRDASQKTKELAGAMSPPPPPPW